MKFFDSLSRHRSQPAFSHDTVRNRRGCGGFFKHWVKVMWLDVFWMLVLAGTAFGVYNAPVATTRNFPITFNGSGDIIYPAFAYPERGWIIESWLSGFLSVVIPIIVILLAQIRVRSFWDANNGIMGLLWAIVLATVCQVFTKQTIGGFRPYWLSVCMPDISLAASNNASGLNGVGYEQVMYTIDICTNPDKDLLKLASTSFPSGHATTGFAGFTFLFLYMNAKLKVWSSYRPAFWKVALVLAPLLFAFIKSALLTVDQAHHWYDIIAGAFIGICMAVASYRGCYAAIFDPRFNHIPLTRNVELDYAMDTRMGAFTRVGRWGKRDEDLAAPKTSPLGSTSALHGNGANVSGRPSATTEGPLSSDGGMREYRNMNGERPLRGDEIV